MDGLLLSEYSLGRLPPLLLSLAIGFYFLFQPKKTGYSRLITVYFAFAFLFHLGFFIVYTVYTPNGAFGYYLTALSPIGLAVLVAFAYRFPEPVFEKEAKYATAVSFILAMAVVADYFINAATSSVSFSGLGYASEYISHYIAILNGSLFLWVIIVFVRKTLHFKNTGGPAKLCRNYSMLVFAEALNAFLISSQFFTTWFSYHWFHNLMNILFFIIYIFYVTLYLSGWSSPVPVVFKVMGTSLVSLILLAYLAGNLLFSQVRGSLDGQYKNEMDLLRKVYLPKFAQQKAVPGDVPQKIDYIIDYSKQDQPDVLFVRDKETDASGIRLFSDPPGIAAHGLERNEYPTAEASLHRDGLGYSQDSRRNYYHYNTGFGERLLGIGFNYLARRQAVHESLVNVLYVYLLAAVIVLFVFPFILTRIYHQPLRSILEDLYQTLGKKNTDGSGVYTPDMDRLSESLQSIIQRQKTIEAENQKLKDRLQSTLNRKDLPSDFSREKVKQVIAYLEENYRSEISREGLAASVDLSPDRLGKYFKQISGMKIGDYINELRLAEAMQRLQTGNEPILEIALAAGFESLRTFNRAFQKKVGTTPGNYRTAGQSH